MSSLIRKSGICLILVAFVFSMIGSALHAASKHELFELSKNIKQTKSQISNLQAELRKLNEEGGPQAQEQAQVIMAQIKELREQLKGMEKNLEHLKNGTAVELEAY